MRRMFGRVSSNQQNIPSSPSQDSPSKRNDSPKNLGLEEVTGPITSPCATVVFVHGLGGHPVKTWRRSDTPNSYWPRDWLPKEEGLERLRVMMYGYDAQFLTTDAPIVNISDFATQLVMSLRAKNIDSPIIFVAHSMGGLVCKLAYMLATEQRNMSSKLSQCIKAGGMIFLATPHRGSDSASILHKVLAATIGSKVFVRELMRNSDLLTSINEKFRHYANDLTLYSFFETLPTPIMMFRRQIIVDRDSAVCGYPDEHTAHIDGDHRSLCKFVSENSPGYVSIKNAILHIIQDKAYGYGALAPGLGANTLRNVLGEECTVSKDQQFFGASRRVVESCRWIFDKDAYQWWESSSKDSRGRYLWITAPPGAGKSVTVSAVIDQFSLERKPVAFYFFRANDSSKRSTRSFMIAMATQMAMVVPEFFRRLVDTGITQRNIQTMPASALWQAIFVEILFQIEILPRCIWHWVVDGIDEADHPGEIVSLLAKIRSNTPIHVLLASRNTYEIGKRINQFIAVDSLRQEDMTPDDTKEDMRAYVTDGLNMLPFPQDDIDDIAWTLVKNSQGVFLWLTFAVEEVLVTAHSLSTIRQSLRQMPTQMFDFLTRTVEDMCKMVDNNKLLAMAILQSTCCATRPLTTGELATILKPQFGELASLQYTIDNVCPHLLRVDASGAIHAIHETVREFLLDNQSTGFAVDATMAHQYLALTCMNLWSEKPFSVPISVQTRHSGNVEALRGIHGLLSYAALSWFEHVRQAQMTGKLLSSLEHFLRFSLLPWLEAVGILNRVEAFVTASRGLKEIISTIRSISPASGDLITHWSVDLARIGPKFGRNIVSHPSAVYKLLPPFCPQDTAIRSSYGHMSDISVSGTGNTHWDECLTRITVGRRGQQCRFLASGTSHFAISLGDPNGTAVIYDAESCQELRKLEHGERLGEMNMDEDGRLVVTAGNKCIRIWDIETGEMLFSYENLVGSRCLAAAFQPGAKGIVTFSTDNCIATWDLTLEHRKQFLWKPDQTRHESKHRGAPWAASFSKDASHLSIAYKGWPLEICNVERRERVALLPMSYPVSACFDSTCEVVYGVEMTGRVSRYRLRDLHKVDSSDEAHVVACHPNGRLIATGNSAGLVNILRAEEGQIICSINRYTESVTSLCFSPDGTRLFDIRGSHCNIWTPESLIVDDSSLVSSNPVTIGPQPTKTQSDITCLCYDKEGQYILCGKSNGAVCVYSAEGGQPLQALYGHAETASIEALAWSSDGLIIASADSSGRVLVVRLTRTSAAKWTCAKLFEPASNVRHASGVRDLYINPHGTRLLVSSYLCDVMFSLSDGRAIGHPQVHEMEAQPGWLSHPSDSAKLIRFSIGCARIFSWDQFSECTDRDGIALRQNGSVYTKAADVMAEMRAKTFRDGQIIAVETTVLGRKESKTLGLWATHKFTEKAKLVDQDRSVDEGFESLIGIHRNEAVFLDREMWVCSTAGTGERPVKHFFLPSDWAGQDAQHLCMPIPGGRFIYARRGELFVVKGGLKE